MNYSTRTHIKVHHHDLNRPSGGVAVTEPHHVLSLTFHSTERCPPSRTHIQTTSSPQTLTSTLSFLSALGKKIINLNINTTNDYTNAILLLLNYYFVVISLQCVPHNPTYILQIVK